MRVGGGGGVWAIAHADVLVNGRRTKIAHRGGGGGGGGGGRWSKILEKLRTYFMGGS